MGRFISFSINSASEGSAVAVPAASAVGGIGVSCSTEVCATAGLVLARRSRLAEGEGDREGCRFVISGMVVVRYKGVVQTWAVANCRDVGRRRTSRADLWSIGRSPYSCREDGMRMLQKDKF